MEQRFTHYKPRQEQMIGEPTPVYTHPQPKREWVGLTDEEFDQMLTNAGFTRTDLMMIGACVDDIRQMIETKLRSKNT